MIETARLRLAPFSPGDIDDLFEIRGDEIAMEYWDWPADETIADTRGVAKMIVADMKAGDAVYWTARRRDGAFVGLFDLSALSGDAELGFMVVRAHWGSGYAFEAASAMVAEAWSRGLRALQARVHAGNERSVRLLMRLGFDQIGAPRTIEIRPGIFTNCLFFLCESGGGERRSK